MSFLIACVWNCASDQLAISSSLICIFSGALICSFIWAGFFFFLVSVHLLCNKGWSLRCSPGRGNPHHSVVKLYVGEGSEGKQCCLLHSLLAFSHFPHYPQSNWPFWCSFLGGWVCLCSGTLWVSPTNSPMRLRVSPAAASIPTGVFSQRLEALFP